MKLNWTRAFTAYMGNRLGLTADQEEIALFGLQTLLYPAVTLLCVCLAGWLLGCLWTTVEAALAAILLRFYAHGAHSRTPLTCTLTSLIVFPALGKSAAIIAPHLAPSLLLLAVIAGFVPSLIAVCRCAPADSSAKPVASLQERHRLRLLSLAAACFIVAVQFILVFFANAAAAALALSLGLWWQAFALTGAGHRFATLLDHILSGKEVEIYETSVE